MTTSTSTSPSPTIPWQPAIPAAAPPSSHVIRIFLPSTGSDNVYVSLTCQDSTTVEDFKIKLFDRVSRARNIDATDATHYLIHKHTRQELSQPVLLSNFMLSQGDLKELMLCDRNEPPPPLPKQSSLKTVSSPTTTPETSPSPPHILTLKRALSPTANPVAHIISAAHTIHNNAPHVPPRPKVAIDAYAHSPARVAALSTASSPSSSIYSLSPAVSDFTRESVSQSGGLDDWRLRRGTAQGSISGRTIEDKPRRRRRHVDDYAEDMEDSDGEIDEPALSPVHRGVASPATADDDDDDTNTNITNNNDDTLINALLKITTERSAQTFSWLLIDQLFMFGALSADEAKLVARHFRSEDISSIHDILQLNRDDLKEMGLKVGPRNRIMNAITKFKEVYKPRPSNAPHPALVATHRDSIGSHGSAGSRTTPSTPRDDIILSSTPTSSSLSDIDTRPRQHSKHRRTTPISPQHTSRRSRDDSTIGLEPHQTFVFSSIRPSIPPKPRVSITTTTSPRSISPTKPNLPTRPSVEKKEMVSPTPIKSSTTTSTTTTTSSPKITPRSIVTPSPPPDAEYHSSLAVMQLRRDESYDVIKVNARKRKQRRILRLTVDEIQNIKGGSIKTVVHTYTEVFCVTLADHETLVIAFINDKSYTYISPIAMQIVHEINERLNLHRAMDKHKMAYNLAKIAIDYQEKLASNTVRLTIIEEERKQELAKWKESTRKKHTARPTAAQVFEQEKKEEEIPPPPPNDDSEDPPPAPADDTTTTSSGRYAQKLLNVIKQGTFKQIAPKQENSKRTLNRQALKLEQMTGTTHDQRMSHAIDKYLLDPGTDEGKARTRFLKNIGVLEKEPHTMCGVVRQFMDSLKHFVEKKRLADIRKVAAQNGTLPAPSTDDDLVKRIGRSIESAVVMPIYQRIITALRKITSTKDDVITSQMKQLRLKDQSWFGIAEEDAQEANWSNAVYELSEMDKKTLPSDKLTVLLSTAKAIYEQYNFDRNKRHVETYFREQLAIMEATRQDPSLIDESGLKTNKYFLSADEFFPIFVYVVSNSQLEYPELSKQYMWGLCEKDTLNGEGGYYLTVFEAALEYIRTLDIKNHQPQNKPRA